MVVRTSIDDAKRCKVASGVKQGEHHLSNDPSVVAGPDLKGVSEMDRLRFASNMSKDKSKRRLRTIAG